METSTPRCRSVNLVKPSQIVRFETFVDGFSVALWSRSDDFPAQSDDYRIIPEIERQAGYAPGDRFRDFGDGLVIHSRQPS